MLLNKKNKKDNIDDEMREITARILLAVLGGGLLYYSLSYIFSNFGNLFNFALNSILAIVVLIVGLFLIYKARYY